MGRDKVEVCSKIWLQDGEVVFGEGRFQIFKAIEETGSINKAAAKLSMSYRAAWGKVKATEDRLGIRLVERHPGGCHGKAMLTPECRKLVEAYVGFRNEADMAVEQLFNKYFGRLLAENGQKKESSNQ